MEQEEAGQAQAGDVTPQPVGYLAGILERVKNLGPPPPRQRRGMSPGGETAGNEA